eukprot:GHRR01000279.1.p1 GENE.GHRR01000279.1~~GHRR01000279.1.p1  ORF type:complete len:362 (+),score=75.18 GHRR01000279.1:203-1288(+)
MSHTPENGLSDPAKESDDMGIFNRRKGSDRGSDADSSSAVNGTSASGGHLAVKGFGSHPVTDVKAVTGDHVSFSDGIQAVAGAPGGAYVEDGYRGKANQLPTAQTASQQVGKHADDQQQRSSQTSKGDAYQGLGKVENGLFLDEQELLHNSTFPIPPERLIELAKDVLRAGVHKYDNLAHDFCFTAPFIGPLNKEDFAQTQETLELESVFPDLAPRIYHMRVDPLEPNRVWFTTRPIGTHLGYLRAGLPIPVSPTGKRIELPPQTSSLAFNEQGEVIDFTMGYVMDRRQGNTDGLGGAFGLLYAIGCPFPYPEGKPWLSSWQQRLFNSGNPLLKAVMFVYDRATSLIFPAWLITKHGRNNN